MITSENLAIDMLYSKIAGAKGWTKKEENGIVNFQALYFIIKFIPKSKSSQYDQILIYNTITTFAICKIGEEDWRTLIDNR
jgi:hypothetical protein